MTEDKMPEIIYLFSSPKSIGDYGFTIAEKDFEQDEFKYDRYHHDDKYQAVVKERNELKENQDAFEDLRKDLEKRIEELERKENESIAKLKDIAECYLTDHIFGDEHASIDWNEVMSDVLIKLKKQSLCEAE